MTVYQKPVEGQYTMTKTQKLPIKLCPFLLPKFTVKLK